MKILNFGSLNIDYIYQVEHFPSPGETLSALEQHMVPGGKGLNQSNALARAGAHVYHAGVVGQGGEMLPRVLANSGVDISLLREKPVLQGNAIIQVNRSGENCILLYGGSNQAIDHTQLEETLSAFSAGDLIVLQNEVSCLTDMVDIAVSRGMRVALNPSPFNDKLKELPLDRLDWLFINEIEGTQLTGRSEPADILRQIRENWPSLKVVLTLGGEGAVCAVPGQPLLRHPAFPVNAVDTTAAGDTFTGFFLAGYAAGLSLPDCLKRAAAAAAISVSHMGASVSIPTANDVDSFLNA